MKQAAAFPRVVWATAPDAPLFASAHLSISAVAEVYGPPDVRGRVARWAFADGTGKICCAIVARAGDNFRSDEPLRMDFVTPARLGRPFFDWATERINLTENGDLAPAFLVA
jgi:hypothetical protein